MLKKIDIRGQGFTVLKDYNSWRIAQIGYDVDVNSVKGVKTLGRHLETDEVFVLITGTAYMVTAGFEDVPSEFQLEKLESGKLYVVTEKQWHAALLEPESTVLIIENENTDASNSINYTLSENEKREIEELINTKN